MGALLAVGAPAPAVPVVANGLGLVSASVSSFAVPAAKKKPRASVSATYAVLASGKVRVKVTSNAKKVQVSYRTSKNNTKRTVTKTVKKGKAQVTLPRGSKAIKVRGKATSELRTSAWLTAVPANPTDSPSAVGVAGALTRIDVDAGGNPVACRVVEDPNTGFSRAVAWFPGCTDYYKFPDAGAGTWSPDGSRVAFAECYNSGGNCHLFVKDLGTGAVGVVSTAADGATGVDTPFIAASWSPDSTRIAFVSAAPNLVPGDTNSQGDVFIKTLATGAIARVSVDSSGNQMIVPLGGPAPAWSPDGTKLAFSAMTGTSLGMVVKDLSTQELITVSTAGDGWQCGGPVWTPNGARLAFTCSRVNSPATPTVWEWTLTTRTSRTVLTDPAVDTVRVVRYTPDGTQLLGDRLACVDTSCTSLVRARVGIAVADGTVQELPGEWGTLSPDGTKLAFDDGRNVFVRNFATGTVVRVSTQPDGSTLTGDSRYPSWSPDGHRVLFINRAGSEAWYAKTIG